MARRVTGPPEEVEPELLRMVTDTVLSADTRTCFTSMPEGRAALQPMWTVGVLDATAPVTVTVRSVSAPAAKLDQLTEAEAVSIAISVLIWLAVR